MDWNFVNELEASLEATMDYLEEYEETERNIQALFESYMDLEMR